MGRFQGGRGQARGRGNRSNNRNNSQKKSNNNTSTQRKGLSDYIYSVGKAAADYDTITKYLLLHIRKNYLNGDDIGNALETLEETTFESPTLQQSSNANAEIKALENKQYEMVFEAKLALYLKKEEVYQTNKGKAYAFLFGQCSKVLQAKILERKDYDKSNRDPIKLLQTIREVSLSYQDTKYDMKIITQAIKNMVNLKQKEDENLIDYVSRFKVTRDVMKAHMGQEIVLHKVVRNDPDFVKDEYTAGDKEKNAKIVKKHYDRWLAYLLLENCDKNKYGTIVNGLDSQQALGNDQYPKTVTAATEVLSNHKFDQAYYDAKKKRGNTRTRGNDTTDQETATQEGQEQNSNTLNLSFANIEGKCYCCGKSGHKSPQCRMKDKIPREEWAINKAAKKENLHVHTSVNNSDETSSNNTNTNSSNSNSTADTASVSTTSTNNSSNTAWTFAQIGQQLSSVKKEKDLENVILLDNQSSEDLFGNSKLVRNIHTVDEALELNTNAGVIKNNQKAMLPNYGKVWYNPEAIANILSFAKLKDKGNRILYDSDKEDAFIVHTKNGIIKFERTPNNLYALNTKKYTEYNLLETVEQNTEHYTNRQIEKAKQARALYHALGTPTIKDFKAILRMNAIKNCPITLEDIDVAEFIYGKDIGAIKGKTVRQKPHPHLQSHLVNKILKVENYYLI